MNKSYSKIRHIQEANKMLEKRLLSETELNFDIKDDDSLGYGIIQCYADSRSNVEMKKLLKNNTNFLNRGTIIKMINEAISNFKNASAISNSKEIGSYFIKNKNFISEVQSLLKKYNIPLYPKS
jgi:hypothetical protein